MLWLILGSAALRLALAAGTGLGIDESYMVAAGRSLQLSYFDHPGMSWWLSRLAALALGSEAPPMVRLPFIALFALSTWLMFVWTRRMFGARAGVWAAVGLNLSPVFSLTTATWVLPDGPLICALLGAAYCLVRGLDEDRAQDAWLWWSLSGVCAGLALLSKYSAILVLAGAVLYFLTQPAHRVWLRRPHPYVAALIALACCTPIVVWNAQHHWASVAFQGGRAQTAALHVLGPPRTIAGEALFVAPWIWLPMMLAWWAALRRGPAAWRSWLPACLGAVPVILFVVVSLWARNILFHWAAPGYLMLFPPLGEWAARREARWLRVGARWSATLLIVGGLLLVIEARVNLVAPFGIDPGLQETDWTLLRDQLAARGLLHRPDTVIAATSWAETGKLDYGLGGAARVICLNPDRRQYQFLDPGAPAAEDVLIIGVGLTSQRLAPYAGLFERVDELPALRLRATPVAVFLGHGRKS